MPQTVNVPGVGQLQFPDGMSQQDMATAIQRNFPQIHAGGTASPAPEQDYNQIPRTPEEQARYNQFTAEMRAKGPDKLATFGDKIIGAGEAGLSTVSGLTTGAVGMLGGAVSGAIGNLTNGAYGNPHGVEAAMEEGARNNTYVPRTKKGQEYAQAIGEAVQNSGVQGLPIGPELAAIGSLVGPSAKQVSNAARNSTEAYIAQKLAQKAANTKLTPQIDAEKAALAQKAADIGIEAPLSSLSDNKYVKIAGEFLDNLPLSGSAKNDNEIAVNKSLISQIGGDAKKFEKLTPSVYAETVAKVGKGIETFNKSVDIPFADEALQGEIASIKSQLPRKLSDTDRVISGYIDELSSMAQKNNGIIPGTTFNDLRSDVLRELRGKAIDNQVGLRALMQDFESAMGDAVAKQLKPEDVPRYDLLRMQYAKAKAIEPLVARSGLNGISPQALLGQLNSTSQGKHRMATNAAGELGDLARIAQHFMKESPTSNTAERATAINAVLAPVRAIGGIAAGRAYNAVARPLARRMVKNSIEEVPQPVAQPLGLIDYVPENTNAWPTAAETPYTGTLTAEQAPINIGPRQAPQLATSPDVPSVDFPSFETQPMPIQRAGDRPVQTQPQGPGVAYDNGMDFYGNQPAPAATPVADTGLMSLADQSPQQAPVQPQNFPNAGGNGIDFPLRQEILQTPAVESAVNAYRTEAARLQQLVDNAISPAVRQKAASDLLNLREGFAAGMRQLGIRNPQEAIGLQPLYEAGVTPRLEVQKTFDPRTYTPEARRQQVNTERMRLKLQAIGDAQTVDEAIKAASQ